MTPKNKRTLIIVAVLIVLGIIGQFLPKKNVDSATEKNTATTTPVSNYSSTSVEPDTTHPWAYKSSVDEMTSKTVYEAQTQMINTIVLDNTPDDNANYNRTRYHVRTYKYPTLLSSSNHVINVSSHKKSSYADVSLHVKKSDGVDDIFFTTSNGQFDINDSKIRIRFDDQDPMTVDIVGAKDDPRTFLIVNPKPIIVALKKASKAMVEVGFVGEGIKIMKYSVQGFEWVSLRTWANDFKIQKAIVLGGFLYFASADLIS